MVVFPLIIKNFSSLREYGIILCKLPPYGIICLIILIYILIELFTTCRSSHTFFFFLTISHESWGSTGIICLIIFRKKNGGTDANPGSQKSPLPLMYLGPEFLSHSLNTSSVSDLYPHLLWHSEWLRPNCIFNTN